MTIPAPQSPAKNDQRPVGHETTHGANRGANQGSCHGHHHHHHHVSADGGDTRRLMMALCIIGGFAVIEVIGGVISGSLALLADAGHMAMDGFAIALALWARHLAAKPPSRRFPFGQKRAQVLAAFVNGLALFVIVAILHGESIGRLGSPQEVGTTLMMVIAVIGLGANILAFWVLHRGDQHDVNMRGAILHVISDILGSIAAIVSAIVIMTTGWLAADALVTMVVCALIARSAWGLVKETGIVLLQGAPPDLDLSDVEATIKSQVPKVVAVSDARVWMLTPDNPQLTMRVTIDEPQWADITCERVKTLLKERFNIDNSTIELRCRQRVRPNPFAAKAHSNHGVGGDIAVAEAAHRAEASVVGPPRPATLLHNAP